MISDEDILSDCEDTINAGFSTLQTAYTTPVFNPQITHKSPVRLRNQGLKCPAEESLVLNQVCSPSRKNIRTHLSKKDACVQILQEL